MGMDRKSADGLICPSGSHVGSSKAACVRRIAPRVGDDREHALEGWGHKSDAIIFANSL
jgi:hypothetical protein